MYQYCIKKNVRKIFFVLSFLTLSAFTLARKVEPIPNLPEGNPNLEIGIVIRFDSTAKDILADSSQSVRFNILRYYKSDDIFSMATPISDFSEKKSLCLIKILDLVLIVLIR